MPTSFFERLAPRRPRPVKLLHRVDRRRGEPLPDGELRRWLVDWYQARAHEQLELGPIQLRFPEAGTSLSHLASLDEGWHLRALLCGCALIGEAQDTVYLAAERPAADGGCRVFSVTHDEPGKPRRVRQAAPSIAAWLFDALGERSLEQIDRGELREHQRARRAYEQHARRHKLAPVDDPAHLFARSQWLADWLLVALGNQASDGRPTRASSLTSLVAERELLSQRADLALYWLWAEALLQGSSDTLGALLGSLARHHHPLVRESVKLARAVVAGKADQRLADHVAELRQRSAPTQQRRRGTKKSTGASGTNEPRKEDKKPREREALATLERAAKRDKRVGEALRLLRDFDAGKHTEDPVDWRVFVPQQRFGELIDERFAPLLVARIRRGARAEEHAPQATRGVIYGWGKVAGSFETFQAVIDKAGVERYGEARLEELYRVWGELADTSPGASARLIEAAGRFLDDTSAPTHREAFRQLLTRQGPEIERMILVYLEGVTLDDLATDDQAAREGQRMLCIEVIFAAARLKLAAATEHIKRLIGGGLGTRSDSERIYRGRLLRALYHTEGQAAYPFTRGSYARFVAASGAEKLTPLTDGWSEYYHELACLVAAMHMMRPGDEWARSLFLDAWRRYALMGESGNQIDYVGMVALLRAVEEAHLDGYEQMLLAFAAHRVEPRFAHQQRWANAVREIAAHLCRVTPGCPTPTCDR